MYGSTKSGDSSHKVRPVSDKLLFMQWENDASHLKKLLSGLKKFVKGLNKVLCWKRRLSDLYCLENAASFFNIWTNLRKFDEWILEYKIDVTWLINHYMKFTKSAKTNSRRDFRNVLENYEEVITFMQYQLNNSKLVFTGLEKKSQEWFELLETISLSIEELIKSIGKIVKKIDDNLSYCLCMDFRHCLTMEENEIYLNKDDEVNKVLEYKLTDCENDWKNILNRYSSLKQELNNIGKLISDESWIVSH